MVFPTASATRSEEHTSELQSLRHLVCRLLLEKRDWRFDRSEEQPSELHSIKHLVSRFFNDPATTYIYTLSLHDALPIYLLGLMCFFFIVSKPMVPLILPERDWLFD